MERIKVGVIGLGEVAQVIHLPILAALSDRFEIAAVCDISPTLVQVIGDRYGVPHRYDDPIALTQQADLDAVFVLNSDEYHADCVIAAAYNHKHVLVEKPMCLNLNEAQAIIQARDAGDVRVMVGYMRRFAPAFTQAKQALPSLGPIQYARIRDIIGRNRLIVDQSSIVLRPDDFPEEMAIDRAERAVRLVKQAIGEAPPDIVGAYRFLLGLNSHDISAMRDLLGLPQGVVSARQWNGGASWWSSSNTMATAPSSNRESMSRSDSMPTSRSTVKRNRSASSTTPPTSATCRPPSIIHETSGDAYEQRIVRPTFKDPYTHEIEHFYEVVTQNVAPRTPPEDFVADLEIMRQIVDAMRA